MAFTTDGTLQQWKASSSTLGYSVRQTEEAMNILQKENFNLKLKMFLIKSNQSESVMKSETNELCNDMAMENQTMKCERNDNQILLKDALKVIKNLEERNLNLSLKIQALEIEKQNQLTKKSVIDSAKC